jgi:hypothetical protein
MLSVNDAVDSAILVESAGTSGARRKRGLLFAGGRVGLIPKVRVLTPGDYYQENHHIDNMVTRYLRR